MEVRNCTESDFSANEEWEQIWEELMMMEAFPLCIDNLKETELKNTLSSGEGSSVEVEVKKCRGQSCNKRAEINLYVENLQVQVYGLFDKVSFSSQSPRPTFSQNQLLAKAILYEDMTIHSELLLRRNVYETYGGLVTMIGQPTSSGYFYDVGNFNSYQHKRLRTSPS